jgi:hypothetical protein
MAGFLVPATCDAALPDEREPVHDNADVQYPMT